MLRGLFSTVIVSLILSSSQTQQKQSASETFRLSGRVIDAVTSRPLTEVNLNLESVAIAKIVVSARTDADGAFQIDGIAAGEYRLITSKEGYAPARPANRKSPGGSLFVRIGRSVPNSEIFIKLEPACVIAGSILDSNGAPVSGVRVLATQEVYNEYGERIVKSSGSVFGATNDRGEFRIYGLQSGDYLIFARGPQASRSSVSKYVPVYYPGVTDASDASTIFVNAGEVASIQPVFLRGTKLVPVHVSLVNEAHLPPGEFRTIQYSDEFSIFAVSQAYGGPYSLNLEGLPFGPNRISVGGYLSDDSFVYGEAELKIADNAEQANAVITLRDAVTTSFYISEVYPDGKEMPVARAAVRLEPMEHNLVIPKQASESGPDGIAKFYNTAVANYHVAISNLPEDLYVSRMLQDGQKILSGTINVHGALRVEVITKPGAGSIDVTVRDSGGHSTQGSQVAIIPADPVERNQFYLDRSAASDQNGVASLIGLAPGKYKLFAWRETAGLAPYRNSDFVKKYEDRGVEVLVSEKEHLRVEIPLADE